jgi:hypothetical protein
MKIFRFPRSHSCWIDILSSSVFRGSRVFFNHIAVTKRLILSFATQLRSRALSFAKNVFQLQKLVAISFVRSLESEFKPLSISLFVQQKIWGLSCKLLHTEASGVARRENSQAPLISSNKFGKKELVSSGVLHRYSNFGCLERDQTPLFRHTKVTFSTWRVRDGRK